MKGSIGYDQQDSNEDQVSPVRIVHQVETQQDAFVDGTAVVTLSYSVANRRAQDALDLSSKFCNTAKKFLFVTSATEVAEEWHRMTTTTLPKLICNFSEMRARNAEFTIFPAADPRRHKLRYILIEPSFRQDREAKYGGKFHIRRRTRHK